MRLFSLVAVFCVAFGASSVAAQAPVYTYPFGLGRPSWSYPLGWRREIKARFTADTGCQHADDVKDAGGGMIIVSGCDRQAKYLCTKSMTCSLQELPKTSADRVAEARAEQQHQAALQKLKARVEQQKHEKGYLILRAILQGQRLEIRVTAAPTMDSSEVLWTMRFKEPRAVAASPAVPVEPATASNAPPGDDCKHALVANGQPILLPEVSQVAPDNPNEFRFKLPIAEMIRVAKATRVVGRTCEIRWELDQDSMRALTELVVRFQETLALEGSVSGTQPAAPRPELPQNDSI